MPSTSSAAPHSTCVISIIEKCHFKAHPCQNCGRAKTNPVHKKSGGACKYKRKNGCMNCGKAKGHEDHMGAPPSLNIFGSGNPQLYITLKQQWEEIFTRELEKADFPKGMEFVSVQAKVIFPDDRYVRDEGNMRFLIEKALGDALVQGKWLVDDCFYPLRRYTFGSLQSEHGDGVSGVILTIWPEG